MSLLSPSSNAGRQLRAVTQPLASQFYIVSNCRGMGSLGIFILLSSLSEETFAVLKELHPEDLLEPCCRTSHCLRARVWKLGEPQKATKQNSQK